MASASVTSMVSEKSRSRARQRVIWPETNMTLFAPTVFYRRIAVRGRRISSKIAFGVWASVGLIALAIISVTLGIAPVVDPTMFSVP